ncbi:DUF494 family protein [Legionella sp. W05-934-2]|jgi:Smg protein|uniref:DUF494 family protein n=1 Tax=Legionella sp. W05-934-2 TaxID=1198649 RepID=UPI00346327DB
MKTQLFNDLMLLFKQQFKDFAEFVDIQPPTLSQDNVEPAKEDENPVVVIKEANPTSTRVYTPEELMRFTKASHQFLVRLHKMGIFSPDYVEMVINHLLISGSKVISLGETKWFVRDFIREELSDHQLAFLDLVLYQKEDQVSIQ